MRRMHGLRRTMQRGSAGLPRTQLCYRLPGGGPLGRCHCCTFKDLPRPPTCYTRRPSNLVVFQELDTAPSTSPRKSESLLIAKRKSIVESRSNKERDDKPSEHLPEPYYSSMSLGRPSEQFHAAPRNAEPEEQGALASIKTFIFNLINQSLRRSIVADLNPIERLTGLTLRKNKISEGGAMNPPRETSTYSRANRLTDQGSKKPSESSIDQKAHKSTERGPTNHSSDTSTYKKAHLITEDSSRKPSESSMDQKAHRSTKRHSSDTSTYKKAHLITEDSSRKPSESSMDQKAHRSTKRHSSDTSTYKKAHLITEDSSRKPSESSMDQKADKITDRGPTNHSSDTSTYKKAHLITEESSRRPSESSSSKKTNKITDLKPERSKDPYLNEKGTYRKSHSIVYHDKAKPSEKSVNAQFNTIGTQCNTNEDIDGSGNRDVLPRLKRMHSEVDILEARLDALQNEIRALHCGNEAQGYDSDICTEVHHPMAKDSNCSMDSACAEQAEDFSSDEREFVSDVKSLFKKYTKKNPASCGCSHERLRRPCYRGTALCIEPGSHRSKICESRRKGAWAEGSGKHEAQQCASVCDLCSHKDLPIVDDLVSGLKQLIGNRPYTDVMLIILLRGDNVYHISVQVKSSNQVLGCILATQEAIEEAISRGRFNEILTFCLIDRYRTLKPHGSTSNCPFKFLARVNTKADKTDACQLDSRAKNFITNVLGRQLPQ